MSQVQWPDWRHVSATLWSRAARYAHAVGTAVHDERLDSPGFFFLSDLDGIDKAGPKPGAWWWIYAPLLRALLTGGAQSPAFLVGLGHHTRISRTYTKRQWIHFLPDSWHTPAELDALAHLVWMVSYNASLDEPQKLPMLLSTSLLEMLNEVDNDHGADTPILHPLLLDFADGNAARFYRDSVDGGMWPFITADLSDLRAKLLLLDKNFRTREMVQTRIADDKRRAWPAVLDLTPTTVPRPCLSESYIDENFRQQYQAAKDTQRDGLANLLNLTMPCFEATAHSSSLDLQLRRLPPVPEGEPTTLETLLNFSCWLHDLTAGRESDWAHLLTALSWWPSLIEGRRWSSIVVYLRPGALETNSSGKKIRLPHWALVPDVVASFAAASGYTAEVAARADEQASTDERVRINDFLRFLPSSMPSLFVKAGNKTGVRFNGVYFRLPDDDGYPLVGEFIRSKQDGEQAITPAQVFERARNIRAPAHGNVLTRDDMANTSTAGISPGNIDKKEKVGHGDSNHVVLRWSQSWLTAVQTTADAHEMAVDVTSMLENAHMRDSLLEMFVSVIGEMIREAAENDVEMSKPKVYNKCADCFRAVTNQVDITTERQRTRRYDVTDLCNYLYCSPDSQAAALLNQIKDAASHLFNYTAVADTRASQVTSDSDNLTEDHRKKCYEYVKRCIIKLELIAGKEPVGQGIGTRGKSKRERKGKKKKAAQQGRTTQGDKAAEVRTESIYPSDEHTRAAAGAFAEHLRTHLLNRINGNNPIQYGGDLSYRDV